MQTESKIVNREELVKQVSQWQARGEQVVFTNGCFDILHLGHVDYLEKAAALGDRLVVAINTDASVRELKGTNRPIQDQYARARLLAALEFVDAVTFFHEATPLEIIQSIMPDILIKGDDYQLSNIVGADIVLGNGGKVLTIPLVKGYSTTTIINKIKGE